MTNKEDLLFYRLLAMAADLVRPVPTDDTALIEELHLKLGRTEREHWFGPSREYVAKLIIAARLMSIIERAKPKAELLDCWRAVAADVGLPEDTITLPEFHTVQWHVKPEVEKRLREMNLI